MVRLNHKCESCSSEFVIEYDEIESETDPLYCPFCSEYMLDIEDEFEDE